MICLGKPLHKIEWSRSFQRLEAGMKLIVVMYDIQEGSSETTIYFVVFICVKFAGSLSSLCHFVKVPQIILFNHIHSLRYIMKNKVLMHALQHQIYIILTLSFNCLRLPLIDNFEK